MEGGAACGGGGGVCGAGGGGVVCVAAACCSVFLGFPRANLALRRLSLLFWRSLDGLVMINELD